MDPLKVQILLDHQSSPSSMYTVAKPKSKPTKSLILLTIAILAVTFGLVYGSSSVLLTGRNWNLRNFRYSVIIDAGSSGTRIHVFRYWFQSGKPVFDFGEENYGDLKLSPGLSTYADNPEGASESVTKLVEFAKGRIPKRMLKRSDIRLMATAGMRLLDLEKQEEILEVTRKVLRSSGFMFRDEWALVIPGSDEGIYAWVTANHALGSLGGDPLKTTGIVEVGGASAQVTFVASEVVPPEYSHTISYGKVSYKIYTHSFLHFGQDQAMETFKEKLQNLAVNNTGDGVVTDPCTPKGYNFTGPIKAAGNFSECRAATYAMLQEGKEKCPYEHCSIGSAFTPHLDGSFLATENIYYTASFFELEEKHWLSELIVAGKSFCGDDWSALKRKYPTQKEKYLINYCFSSAYIISMLHDSLGIAFDDERIEYANKAGAEKLPLDWALGAFILNTAKATSDYGDLSRKFLGLGNVVKYNI